jgi:heme/copper-type cytochrome/quinol oxidase subunit 3
MSLELKIQDILARQNINNRFKIPVIARFAVNWSVNNRKKKTTRGNRAGQSAFSLFWHFLTVYQLIELFRLCYRIS